MATKTEDHSASTSTPIVEAVLLMMKIKHLRQNQCCQCRHQLLITQQNHLQHLGSHLMTFPITNGLLDFKNLLHRLISKEQNQMLNLKPSFVNSWPDLRLIREYSYNILSSGLRIMDGINRPLKLFYDNKSAEA